MLTEDELCEIFAEQVKASPDFAAWLLRRTKFASYAENVRLLDREQMAIRPRKRWWRHWWCDAPGLTKKGRETDIFMVFEATTPEQIRFALHIENKRDSYRFGDGQAADYKVRANHMLHRSEFLNHADFTTVLLATSRFRQKYATECDLFDAFISYEDLAPFLSPYGEQK